MEAAHGLTLTDSQVRQLIEYLEEQPTGEEGIHRSVLIRTAPSLGDGYVEVTILDEDGQPSSEKRVLFPA